MKTSEILKGALDILSKENGWIQNKLVEYNNDGVVIAACAIGGIESGAVSRINPRLISYDLEFDNALRALWKVIPVQRKGVLGLDIVDWNNSPERTQEDVILAFKQAIYNCEEAGN